MRLVYNSRLGRYILKPEELAPLYPYYVYVYIYDGDTSYPIAGATVKNYVMGNLYSSGVTDSNGRARILISTITINHIVASSRGYETLEVDESFPTYHDVYMYLTPLVEPPPGEFYADFYLVDNGKRRIKDAKVVTAYEENVTNKDGLARVLLTQGINNVTFREYYAVVWMGFYWSRVSFTEFTRTVDIQRDTTYTVWAEQGVVQEGIPPTPPFNPMDWLKKYWWAIPVAFGGIYALSLFKPPVVVKVER